jgi:hypothetical protein
MNYNVATYCNYLLLTLFVVFYIGNVLYRNGRPFLLNTFHGQAAVADAVNKVLLAGYYLLNMGYTVIVLKVWNRVGSCREMIEVLSMKVGVIVLTLGIMHLFNVLLLILVGKNKKETFSIHK